MRNPSSSMYIIPFLTLLTTLCTFALANTTPMNLESTAAIVRNDSSAPRNFSISLHTVSTADVKENSSVITKLTKKLRTLNITTAVPKTVKPLIEISTVSVVKPSDKPVKKNTGMLKVLKKERAGLSGSNKIKVYVAVEVFCISLMITVFKFVF